MTAENRRNSVMIIGGSGVVGSKAARLIRSLHPDLPLTIGGRDLPKATRVADSLGSADAVQIDLTSRSLGLSPHFAPSAVVIFFKDEYLNSMRYAQDRHVPYISLSSGTFEIGPEVAQYIQAPNASPVALASHWLAGASLFPALGVARRFRTIDKLRIGLLLDEEDMGGPAASVDFERITGAASSVLTVEDGRFIWIAGEARKATYRSLDGVEVPASAYAPFDVISLGAATDARSIRIDLAYTQSASRRRGEPFSTEIVIDCSGLGHDGRPLEVHQEIVHPDGQAPLTALGITLLVERLLGLDGRKPGAGLSMPETLIDIDAYLQRMGEIGAVTTERGHG